MLGLSKYSHILDSMTSWSERAIKFSDLKISRNVMAKKLFFFKSYMLLCYHLKQEINLMNIVGIYCDLGSHVSSQHRLLCHEKVVVDDITSLMLGAVLPRSAWCHGSSYWIHIYFILCVFFVCVFFYSVSWGINEGSWGYWWEAGHCNLGIMAKESTQEHKIFIDLVQYGARAERWVVLCPHLNELYLMYHR